MPHHRSSRSRAAVGAFVHLAFLTAELGAVTAWARYCEARRQRRI